jgi:folate-dependent phosphoribosylglycinamide formyltransferase PurN
MYGLLVHLHVLDGINDQVERGMAKVTDRFFTTPTVHEVSEEYDQGKVLLQAQVEIPQELIQAWVAGTYQGNEEDVAKKLQQIVLPFEWQMLPCAVRMAAKKILTQ